MAKKNVDVRKALGAVIRARREDAGINTSEMAKKTRLSQAQISRLECGLQGFRMETLATLATLCRVLNAKMSWLLREAGL